MTVASEADAQISVAQATDRLFEDIATFLFERNAIITWLHLTIIVVGVALVWWVGRIKPDALRTDFPCAAFARDVIQAAKSGASSFLTSFCIGFVLFLIGVACDGVEGISSLLVQLLTYMPTMILGALQLRATYVGVALVKKHTGL